MRVASLVLVFLACVGQGRRVQSLPADLLVAAQPTAAWQGGGHHPAMNNGRRASSRTAESPQMQSSLRKSIMDMGVFEETNGKFWDPLGIASKVNDGTLAFLRAAEIKHGRVAMLASVGYLVGAYGITFPGNIAPGISFKSVNADGVFSAWGNVPANGRLQILVTALLIELYTETQKPHYTKEGGDPAKVPAYQGLGIFGDSDPRLAKAELKHGRAAMFGIISFLLHHNLPAAIPVYPFPQ